MQTAANKFSTTINRLFSSRPKRRRSRQTPSKIHSTLLGHPRVEAVDVEDTDGWFVTLRSGWKDSRDPVVPVHCFGASTLSEALREVRAAMPCDCEQCKREIALAKAKGPAPAREL